MPVFFFEKCSDDASAHLLVWELTETADELKSALSPLQLTQYATIVSEKRRREFAGVRVALKALLGCDVDVEYNENGKPYLADRSYNISISHTSKWIAVIAHPTREVGIDIESPSEKIMKVYTRFLSSAEIADLTNGTDIRQIQVAWSAKEALYKIIGKSAVDFSKQLRILPFETKEDGEIIAQHIATNTFFNLVYSLQPQYTLVYCLS